MKKVVLENNHNLWIAFITEVGTSLGGAPTNIADLSTQQMNFGTFHNPFNCTKIHQRWSAGSNNYRCSLAIYTNLNFSYASINTWSDNNVAHRPLVGFQATIDGVAYDFYCIHAPSGNAFNATNYVANLFGSLPAPPVIVGGDFNLAAAPFNWNAYFPDHPTHQGGSTLDGFMTTGCLLTNVQTLANTTRADHWPVMAYL